MTEPPKPPADADEPQEPGQRPSPQGHPSQYPPEQGYRPQGGEYPPQQAYGPPAYPTQGYPPSPGYGPEYPPQRGYSPPGTQPQYPQPQYPQPQYPQYSQQSQYPQQQPYPGGPSQPAGISVTALLGARALRRPEARFGSALAAAGSALAVIGAYVWSIGYFAKGFGLDLGDESGSTSTHGAGRRFLGFALFLVLTLVGYAVVVVRRRGPLATAATVASALSVPAALGFVFLDVDATLRGGEFPINLDALFLISILIWVASYLGIPGARGRAIYLALAATALPSYIAIKASGQSALRAGFSVTSGNGLTSGGTSSHAGTIAAVGLIFGLGYYAIAAVLDRFGRPGVAIGLLYAAFTTTLGGLLAAADSWGQVGTGVALILIGASVALYGGRSGRRFTTWVWAAGTVLGVILIVAKLGTDKYAAIGILLILIGVLVVAVAQVASGLLREAPDVTEEQVAGAPVARPGVAHRH